MARTTWHDRAAARRADVKRLAAFWPRAPRGYRYEVRLNDGTLLDTVQR